jgi:hypothetical protein
MALWKRWLTVSNQAGRPRDRRVPLTSLSLEDLESRTLLSGNAFARWEHSVTTEWHKVIGQGKPHHHVFGINIHFGHDHTAKK